MAKYKEGQQVSWNWGEGTAKGKVQSVFEKKVTRTIKGEEIVRKGSKDNPAYYIQQEDGNNVLKLESELN